MNSRLAPGHVGYPTAIAVQRDGAIVYADGNKVVRLDRDGTADAGFGQDGVTTLPRGTADTADCLPHPTCPPYSSTVNLVLLADGAILDAGGIGEYDPSTGQGGINLLLARLFGGRDI